MHEGSDDITFEPGAVADAHEETLRVVEGLDLNRLGLAWMSPYPLGWCSVMSYTLLQVLERRDLGRWTIVNGQDARGNHHDWLEYVAPDGVLFSVDATQHQFRDLGTAPFVGSGECPAKARFKIGVRTATTENMPIGWAKRAEIIVSAEVMTALSQESG